MDWKQKKNIQKNKLYIVIQWNTKIVNCLDLSVNLNNSNYKPYHKLDIEILYIHKDWNHPPNILKQTPTLAEQRIITLSTNETIFNESKEIYQKALEKAGYQQTLNYHPANENVSNKKQNRKWNVIWFNHNHKKRKDSLEGSLDRVLLGAELKFPKILIPRLPQHTSNVNIECARMSEWSKQQCSLHVTNFLEHWYILILLFWH